MYLCGSGFSQDRQPTNVRTRIFAGISLCAAFALAPASADAQKIIINEIHYHPADGASSGEFVELYNYGERAVDIGGWLLGGAVTYVFPPETTSPRTTTW